MSQTQEAEASVLKDLDALCDEIFAARKFDGPFISLAVGGNDADPRALRVRQALAAHRALVKALTEAIRIIERESDEWLDSAICCSGHDCGCRGSSNRDLVVNDLRAALAKVAQS